MGDRVYNFSAGPSQMPQSVLEKAQKELLNYGGTGTSVMEMSHRSAAFQDIIDSAEETLRRIMNISDEYAVLFLQGGASLQFSMIPMNLLKRGEKALYAVTGNFAAKAYEEATRWADARVITSSKDAMFSYIPDIDPSDVDADAKYLHITGNNTIFGTTYYKTPKTNGVPLVADWSSAILGKEIDINEYELVYAGAQKNIGPAGVTVVIIKKDLLKNEVDNVVPTMLRYDIHADKGSMYNTPPCFAIYVSGLMFSWVESKGGVKEIEKLNCEKAKLLYDYIDNSGLYKNDVRKKDRSITNVRFTLPSKELTQDFLDFTTKRGLINLKGHKLVGGCRASIYNAMPLEGVQKLVNAMKEFERHV